jgi:hypothetical protein
MDEANSTTGQQGSKPGPEPSTEQIGQFVKTLVGELRPSRPTERYANNFKFLPSVWDLRILFGEFDSDKNDADWHSAVTIPWLQVRMVAYFLRLNLAWYEFQNGPLAIPPSVKPKRLEIPTEDTNMQAWQGIAHKIYYEMFGDE